MLNRPSSRRKAPSKIVGLNLVPMIDALVVLITFLLFTMSFFALVSVESPVPIASTKRIEEKLKRKPLQLTLTMTPKLVEIWSPFNRIRTVKINNAPDGQPDVFAIHDAIYKIKAKYPWEKQIVFVPYKGVTYDTLVALMDAVRLLQPTDPPLYAKNKETGIEEQLKLMFPEIVFGNLLGDN